MTADYLDELERLEKAATPGLILSADRWCVDPQEWPAVRAQLDALFVQCREVQP